MGVLVEDLLALARLDERREVEIAPDRPAPASPVTPALDLRAAAPQRTVTVIDTTARAPRRGLEAAARRARSRPTPTAGRRGRRRRATRRSAPPRAHSRCCAAPPVPAPSRGAAADAPSGPLSFADRADPGRRDRPPIVLGDENRIRQVVANLLGNARRFTAEDSPIETCRHRRRPTAPPAWAGSRSSTMAKAFPSRSATRSSSASGGPTPRARARPAGSGLGLSIVASIVDGAARHASRSTDTPGGGATFRVAFPLAPESTLYLDTQPLPELPPRPPLPDAAIRSLSKGAARDETCPACQRVSTPGDLH